MPASDSQTYIVNDQPIERDALDFTPYVETLADIIQSGNTPLTIGVLKSKSRSIERLIAYKLRFQGKSFYSEFSLSNLARWKCSSTAGKSISACLQNHTNSFA